MHVCHRSVKLYGKIRVHIKGLKADVNMRRGSLHYTLTELHTAGYVLHIITSVITDWSPCCFRAIKKQGMEDIAMTHHGRSITRSFVRSVYSVLMD